jgi:D-alanyl-D-alanine carboxypeptidase
MRKYIFGGENMDYLILVDSIHRLPSDFTPKLVDIGTAKLEETAAKHCGEMLLAAESEGIIIKILSAYRSPEYQRQLWNRSVAEYAADGLNIMEAEQLTSRYLAKPYHSEHNTGLACDFCSPDWDDTQDDFYRTPQGKWLCKNAAEYGFILRYPRMKEHITGIAYEPWHYRYVGAEHAKIIREQGLTLEEYLYYYK